MCYHYGDDSTCIVNLMITQAFAFVKIVNENKQKQTKGETKVPNFELTAEGAKALIEQLPEAEYERLIVLLEIDEDEATENEK